ncbi:aminotransferase class III-fold pyridoxal phosphate-dependent enzyme [Lutispora saccharofermentans]|uniref:Aminotransferase class III-fold pyridoxal phosphate-dependent enzyme n=1 Tax=Lutispora saccharofermentans TaxID=3024236 RepID=A0ABT1NJE0_9FIRM|nr:aminotransferase class III-fold pyridoxal phosphate-dependent enzyme [Lutispora saccharofermentans]MCQ1531380.1 aminotransferase class III-fold pyridoxal phosphate-dependent enzyme [Lutispora saccharofermentans]
MHFYKDYVNPYLGDLLENLDMDKSFTKGEGCFLYDDQGNSYLDCIASYGAVPFGYNNEEIWECVRDYYESKEPSFIQPSSLDAAGELAKRLIEICPQGLKYVTFANSGAEAVEAAIKLCRSATGRTGILAAQNSFHGKTLGALSATGKSSYQEAFGAPVHGFSFVAYGDLNSLEAELRNKPGYYAAFIVEPIQGEGGIIEPPEHYLKEAKKLCEAYGVLFVADEIQTGLGRTGNIFACEEEGIYPDVLLVAKALGGGIVPIGACICKEEVYNGDFALKHSSTFAANSLCCRIGIKVLDMLLKDDKNILKKIKRNGLILKEGLTALSLKYPNIIKSVRGKGLMLGIEFGINRDTFPGTFIAIMAEQELLTPVISSYLLNVESIRVAPTLNGSNVIRIEPSLTITLEQCYRALDGIEGMLKTLDNGNTADFISFLVGRTGGEYKKNICSSSRIIPSGDETEGRFAFIVHPTELKNYAQFDKSLSSLKEDELAKLADRCNKMMDPFYISSTRITSKCGETAYGEFIAIPKTAQQFLAAPKNEAVAQLKKAIGLAKKRGAKIVGLGAYTSVISAGGLLVKDEGVAITSGNSFTVASAVDAVTSAFLQIGRSAAESTAAVVGASGSIGRGVSILISEKVSKLILIGNSKNKKSSMERLYRIAGEIYKHIAALLKDNVIFEEGSLGCKIARLEGFPACGNHIDEFVSFAKGIGSSHDLVKISTEIDADLPMADIAVVSTNTGDILITPENLKHGSIVCEMSRPSNVSPDVEKLRPDILVIDGGIIEVPGLPYLGWDFGFEKGHAYACMSETMMLSLEHHYEHTSIGATGVSLESIIFTKKLAEKHGFKLAKLKSFNRPADIERWEKASGNYCSK